MRGGAVCRWTRLPWCHPQGPALKFWNDAIAVFVVKKTKLMRWGGAGLNVKPLGRPGANSRTHFCNHSYCSLVSFISSAGLRRFSTGFIVLTQKLHPYSTVIGAFLSAACCVKLCRLQKVKPPLLLSILLQKTISSDFCIDFYSIDFFFLKA